MTTEEKLLYHQIHPAKLFTDISVTFPALYLFWHRQLKSGLALSFIPSMLVSAWLIRSDSIDLEPYKNSAAGRYIRRNMTPAMQATRLAGFGVMSLGAWLRKPWLIIAGFRLVVFGWTKGLMWPAAERYQVKTLDPHGPKEFHTPKFPFTSTAR